MKNISFCIFVFVFLFLILMNNTFAQSNNYKPFPESIATWTVQSYGPCGPGNGGFDNASYTWRRYYVNGDTTIGSYTYKKVSCANSTNGSYPLNVNFEPSVFCFAYRNDVANKKVYLYTSIDGQYKDTLWYDFNLVIGDTLKPTYSIGSFGDERTIVVAIDSALICGVYHKIFQFNCFNSINESMSLIEGVGFVDNFIATSPMCPFEPVYIYGTSFSCVLESVEEEARYSGNKIELFPNPAFNSLNIHYDKQRMILPYKYSIIDCLGKEICGTINDDRSIDVSTLKNGFYVLKIQDRQMNIFRSVFLKK